MIGPLSTETVAIAVVGIGAVFGAIGAVAGWWYRKYRTEAEEWERELEDALELENVEDDGHSVTLPAPDMKSSLWDLLKLSRHQAKEQKLAKRGYVKWMKFDGMLRRPEWVKPERSGSGVPKYHDSENDVHYLFPEDALVTDARTGAPVAVHHAGEAEPINLKDPEYPPIDADRLEEIINLEIESEPPSWLSKFDLDATTIMWVMIIALLAFAGAQQVMG